MKTKKELINILLEAGIEKVSVVSYPDYNGGRYNKVIFNEDPYTDLDNFEYLEYSEDTTKVIKDRNKIFENHFEPFHEEAYDVKKTLQELILEELV